MIFYLIISLVLFYIFKSIVLPISWNIFKYKFIAPRNDFIRKIKKSGEWAIVTGATDGIGLEYTRQFAKLGMKLFLISRDEEKLKHLVKELKSYYKIEAQYYKANFCSTSIYEGLEEELKNLDIGVLVNNVGMTQPFPCEYSNLSVTQSFLGDMIHCNILSAISMTKIVLPKMVDRKRGIIINISSASSLKPMPMSALYSSSKCYLTQFSRTISYELRGSGVDVQTVRPFFVQTKFIGKFRPPRLFTMSAEEYVSSAIRMVGIESDTFGCLCHAVQGLITNIAPEFLASRVAYQIHAMRARSLHRD